MDSATRGRAQESLVFDHGMSPKRIADYSDGALKTMLSGVTPGGWTAWLAANADAIRDCQGPGAYGGPAEERIATDAEADELKAAGWRELNIMTLWRHDDFEGLHSVDEALATLRRKAAE